VVAGAEGGGLHSRVGPAVSVAARLVVAEDARVFGEGEGGEVLGQHRQLVGVVFEVLEEGKQLGGVDRGGGKSG